MTPVIFGTSCLGNLYKEVDFETKVAVAARAGEDFWKHLM
jgi:hypothetical protein